MLNITTKQNQKTVEVDGFSYKVRRPGAGESLTLQKSGRDLTKLSKLAEPTEAQETKMESMTIELLEICLGLFTGTDEKAQKYIQTLDVEVLLDVINQVFDEQEA
jgi:hypothetical protein